VIGFSSNKNQFGGKCKKVVCSKGIEFIFSVKIFPCRKEGKKTSKKRRKIRRRRRRTKQGSRRMFVVEQEES
jgi:hypothetical protein